MRDWSGGWDVGGGVGVGVGLSDASPGSRPMGMRVTSVRTFFRGSLKLNRRKGRTLGVLGVGTRSRWGSGIWTLRNHKFSEHLLDLPGTDPDRQGVM